MSDLIERLREYASNNGYSHGDYADTMSQAADSITTLKEQNALLTVQVQEGSKLVPVEPTEEMLFAAETSHVRGYRDLYSVMIAAAPDLPQQVKSE